MMPPADARDTDPRRFRRASVLVVGLLAASTAGVSAAPKVSNPIDLPANNFVVAPSDATRIGATQGSNASVSGDGRFVVFQGLPGEIFDEGPPDRDADVDADQLPIELASEPSAESSESASDGPAGGDDPVSDGPEPDGGPQTDPGILLDGRSSSRLRIPANDAQVSTIFLTDRETSATIELTPIPDGLRAGHSVQPVISGDGCTVMIITELALDLFRDSDGDERWDLYRTTLPHCGGSIGNWELVSTRSNGDSLARDDVRPEFRPTVSRSGSLVAYVHPADRLFDSPGVNTITLVDLTIPIHEPLRSQPVAGMPIDRPNTPFVHTGLDQPSLSADGRFLAYRSDAASAEPVASWGSGPVPGGAATKHVFVWDRGEPDPFEAVKLVSVASDGRAAVGDSGEPAVSRDGRIIAFTSSDQGLIPADYPTCTDRCATQVFRLDRDADGNGLFDEPGRTQLELASGVPGDERVEAGIAASAQPALSANGQLVAFVSKAPNLQMIGAPTGGDDTDGDVLVADFGTDALRRVTVAADGVRPTVAAHARPRLSETGRTVVFDTLASGQLLADPTGSGRQVVAQSWLPSLSLADADVGTTFVGLESAGWFVSLVNQGPSGFRPSSITISDRRFEIDPDSTSCAAWAVVPSGGRCNVGFTFTPTSSATVDATLTISEEGYQAVSISSTISGRGGEPALQIEPGGGDLGEVVVGEASYELLFDVSNVSVLPTSVASIEISGANPEDFALYTNNCDDRPLNPRATCAAGVVFIPTDSGRRTAIVEVRTPQGQESSLIVNGDGVFAPELVIETDLVRSGQLIVADGAHYPPNSNVTLVVGGGPGDTHTVLTDDTGAFELEIPITPSAGHGVVDVVAQAGNGALAAAPIEILVEDALYIGVPGFGLGG